MKLSKLMHIASVVFGFIGLFMGALVVVDWLTKTLWFQVDLSLAITFSVVAFLAAIWLQIATIHHMMLEKKGEII